MPSQLRTSNELDYDIRELIEQLSDLVIAQANVRSQHLGGGDRCGRQPPAVEVKNHLATRVIRGCTPKIAMTRAFPLRARAMSRRASEGKEHADVDRDPRCLASRASSNRSAVQPPKGWPRSRLRSVSAGLIASPSLVYDD